MHIHTCDRPGVCPTHPPISRSQLQRTYLTLSPRLPCISARNPLVPADVCGSPHPLPPSPAALSDARELSYTPVLQAPQARVRQHPCGYSP